MDKKWSAADSVRLLGNVKNCYQTYSKNPEVRNGAASGGTTSQILIELLRTEHVDGVLVWRLGTKDGRPHSAPFVAKTPDEVLSARTSIYVATYFARDAMPLIKDFSGRLAVMTLPCDATYLRRRMEKDPALNKKIVGILALFCGHNSLPELTEVVCNRHGFNWDDLEHFSFRTGSWRGDMTMTPKKGEPVVTSSRQFTHMQNLHLFSEKKCLACFDHFGYDADISLGDSWTRGEKKLVIKPTVCVTRTEAGDEMFRIAQDALEVVPRSPSHVLSGNSRGLTYHYNVSARSKVAESMDHNINDRLHLQTSLLERLIAWMGVKNAVWSWRDPKAKEKLTKRSFRSIKAEVYTFKGLQEINSHAWRRYPDNRQISIIGATLTGNQGAAAMLETTIGEIRKRFPEANFVVHSYLPEADKLALEAKDVRIVDATPMAICLSALPAMLDNGLHFLGLRFPKFLMPESLREIRSSAVLIDVAGISLTAGREKFLPFNILCNWPALLVGTPVVKFAQAMGPGDSKVTKLVARFLLKRVNMTFARGKKTMELIAPVAPRDRREFAADIAFLYQDNYALIPSWSAQLDNVVQEIKAHDDEVVAISVSSVVKGLLEKTGQDYIALTKDMIEQLLSEGKRVVVFPNACREGTDALRNNDIPIINALADKLGKNKRLHMVDYAVNTAAIRKVLTHCDALIASRFHAMVAGLSLALPTLVLGWSHKYSEVMEMFSCEKHFLGFEDMSRDAISTAVRDLLQKRDEIRKCMMLHRTEVEALSSVQFAWLDSFLRPEAETSDLDA